VKSGLIIVGGAVTRHSRIGHETFTSSGSSECKLLSLALCPRDFIMAVTVKYLVFLNAFADASISEKPGAVVPHAGICAGPVGQLADLPRCRTKNGTRNKTMSLWKPLRVLCIRTTNLTHGYQGQDCSVINEFYRVWSKCYDLIIKIDPAYQLNYPAFGSRDAVLFLMY
jgi:hypothetical protein